MSGLPHAPRRGRRPCRASDTCAAGASRVAPARPRRGRRCVAHRGWPDRAWRARRPETRRCRRGRDRARRVRRHCNPLAWREPRQVARRGSCAARRRRRPAARALGWEVAVEVSFSRNGERGSIDVLAFNPQSRALVVIEVKSVTPDMQAMLAGVDRKARLAPVIARDRGWDAAVVARIVVIWDTRTNRRRIEAHAASVRAAFLRARARCCVAARTDGRAIRGVWFVSDGARRRRDERVSGVSAADRFVVRTPRCSQPLRRFVTIRYAWRPVDSSAGRPRGARHGRLHSWSRIGRTRSAGRAGDKTCRQAAIAARARGAAGERSEQRRRRCRRGGRRARRDRADRPRSGRP